MSRAPVVKQRTDARDRFWSKVEFTEECWLWMGSGPDGYGGFKLDGRWLLAHRVAYEFEVGQVPAGLCVCHTCDVRKCVRPDHLFIGTNQDNVDDRQAKGRGAVPPQPELEQRARGERHGLARLTPELATAIRGQLAEDQTISAIARSVGLGRTTVRRVRDGEAFV